MEKLESLYRQTASRINLKKSVTQAAWESYLQAYQQDEQLHAENATEWFVVHIYLALLEQHGSKQPRNFQSTSITVSTLLTVSMMHCTEFIRKLKVILEDKLPSPLTSKTVNDLTTNYVLTAALYDKCSRIFDEVFINETAAEDSVEPNYHRLLLEKKKTVWLLYLLAKDAALFDMSELVTSFYVLLCSFVPVVKTTPNFLLKPPYDCLEKTGHVILERLCMDYGADWAEVYDPIYKSRQWVEFAQRYEELSVHAMAREWHTLVKPLSIDSLGFIECSSLLVPASRTGGEEINGNVVQPTPVQYRLNTISHLKTIVSGVCDTPNNNLQRYFQSCEENPEEAILVRLSEMRDRYINGYLNQTESLATTHSHRVSNTHIPEQRFGLIRKLYLRVLETLLEQEEKRLSRVDFSTLLHIDTFHRSLVTCCALVVNHTYNERLDVYESLENLLDTFKIEAYHMCKVIECFIKAEPNMSKLTIKHIKLCENHILESLAWQPNSILFDVLSLTSSGNAAPDSLPSAVGCERDGAGQFLTPTWRRGQDGLCNQSGPSPRSYSLTVFINKVCRLAYHRLQLLCNSLTIPRDVIPKIWTCLEHCIKCRQDLLKGRHLDQIMMCSLYAISKVVDKEVMFKVIVSAYEKLPHQPNSSVYKRVPMGGATTPYASIISFYNQVFMQNMKSYLLQFSPDRRQPTLSPGPKVGHSPHKKSPIRIGQNITVSPLKRGTARNVQMTPRSGQLYCFTGLEGLKQVQVLADITTSEPSAAATKKLRFDDDMDDTR